MSQSVITTAFEQLKAQQAANGGILQLDEFVFANVPDLNIHDPINRAESWPAASDIVYRQAVTKTGMVNNNAVVYSVVLGADVGDFDFNWIGLINKKSNAVCMIVHAPLQKKIKTASGQQGNVLTRSFMMEYDGAAQQTQIITPADTWQIDFTARLNGMDERIRLENIDLWGSAVFFGESFRVTPEGDKYAVKSGTGYVAGLRAELFTDQVLSVPAMGGKVWVDVCWKGTLSGAWSTSVRLTVADALADYHDGDEQHYVFAVAQINADGSVVDLRNTGTEGINHQLDGINHQLDNKQPLSDTLTALARLAGSKDKVPYFPNDKEAALTALTEVGRDLIGKNEVADVLTFLGIEEAAKRKVGNSASQLPDMSFFTHQLGERAGYQKFPSGMIIQWGNVDVPANSLLGKNITFPVAFPNYCAAVWIGDIVENTNIYAFGQVVSKSVTSALIAIYGATANAAPNILGASISPSWVAIGF